MTTLYITDQSGSAQLTKHCSFLMNFELCNCSISRILSVSYLSDYYCFKDLTSSFKVHATLTRSDSTDSKRIPREENTYCNKLHYEAVLHFKCSASEESQITKCPCKAMFLGLLLYPSRASSWCILFRHC